MHWTHIFLIPAAILFLWILKGLIGCFKEDIKKGVFKQGIDDFKDFFK